MLFSLSTWHKKNFYSQYFFVLKGSAKYGKDEDIIRRGDIIHCDIEITYLSLNADMQHTAYVCRKGESGPPKVLIELYKKGNRVQDIMLSEFKDGRTGNKILESIVNRDTIVYLKKH